MRGLIATRTVREGGLYYGWYIVAVAFLAQAMSAGLQVYTFGVFLKPMALDLGIGRAEQSSVQSVATLINGILALFIGPLIDRRGGRALMVVGALITGAGLAALGLVHHLWQLYLVRGVIVTVGMLCMGGLVVNVALSNWFVRRRGRAIAFAAMGISAAAIILPPATQRLIEAAGWRHTWAILGAAVVVLVTLPAALFMRRRPEDLGLNPDGDRTPALSTAGSGRAPERAWSRAEAARTPALWLVIVAFALAGVGMMAMLIHTYPYLTDTGFTPSHAARGLSMIGVAGLISKPVWGLLIERISARWCAAAEFVLCAAGIALIALAAGEAPMYAAIFVFGLGIGGVLTVQEVVWADYFGRLTLGRIRGLAMPFTIASSAGGPVFAGWVFDVTGSYHRAFPAFIATYGLATALILLSRPPRPPTRRATAVLDPAAPPVSGLPAR